MKKSFFVLISLFVLCVAVSAQSNKFIVVIDPGHGGKDGGATRNGTKEKDITLAVALSLGRMIETNMSDVKVVYTRKTDVFIALDRRAIIANKAKASLFISIHVNSTDAKITTATGIETYCLGLARAAENLEVAKRENSVILLEEDYTFRYEGFNPNSPESNILYEFMTNKYMEQSLQLASHVQTGFKTIAKRYDRGVHQAGFLVLVKTSMPSILVELGFVNNPSDAKYLTSSIGERTMATAIYSGFRKYKQNFDKMQGNTPLRAASDSVAEDYLLDLAILEEKLDTVEPAQPLSQSPAKTITSTAKEKPEVKGTPTSANKDQVEYRVQFLYSSRKLKTNSPLFRGLSPVDYYIDGNEYKYTVGVTRDKAAIEKIQKQVRLKFKDAFIVKLKNGKRIL